MNYIVVDLEWNQSPNGKGTEVKGIPFEIIEIGAVKLDSNFQEIGQFSRLIKPQIYKEIHSITKEIIHLQITDLLREKQFDEVIKEFFEWCGEDYRFATWGNLDLIELQRNLMYYNLNDYINRSVKFYDVQKLFAIQYYQDRIPRTLEYAVDVTKLEKNKQFHRAYVDAQYTADILKMIDKDVIEKNYSIDYYQNPKSKEEEIVIHYETYSKYITQEYDTKEDLMANKDVNAVTCSECKRRVAKKVKWFTTNSKTYYCLGFCKEHGFIKGKIRIKRALDNKVFAVKVVKNVTDEEANVLLERFEEAKKRKRQKRINIERHS